MNATLINATIYNQTYLDAIWKEVEFNPIPTTSYISTGMGDTYFSLLTMKDGRETLNFSIALFFAGAVMYFLHLLLNKKDPVLIDPAAPKMKYA